VGSLWNTYLFLANQGRLIVVDQHAAAERITFERLRSALEEGQEVPTQRLLIPAQVIVDAESMATLEAHQERIKQVGLELEPFGPTSIRVLAVPALLSGAPVAVLVRDVLDELAELDQSTPWEKARCEVLGRMACHASVRAGQALSVPEARGLLTEILRVDFAGTCPHGRPVLVEFGRSEVERWFQRT